MSVTRKERELARLLARDTARYERAGVAAATRTGARALRLAVSAWKGGRPYRVTEVAAKEILKGKDELREAMVAAHLVGLRRSNLMATISLSALSGAVRVLRDQLKLSESQIKLLRQQYDAEAFRVLSNASDAVERKLQRAMITAIQEGMHVREGVEEIGLAFKAAGITPASSFQFEAIYRTQMQMAYGAAKWQADQDPVIDEILWGYKYITVGDDRVRPEHEALEGTTLPKKDSFWDTSFPPNGWACVTPDTMVCGNILWCSKAAYSGPLIELRTIGGHRLTVTPNHPVATRRGWVAAKHLHEADDLLYHGGEIELVQLPGRPKVPFGTLCNQKVPSRIDDVFQSLLPQGTCTVQSSSRDFHGDARRFIGKVDIVSADRELLAQLKATGGKKIGKDPFPMADARLVLESSNSYCPEFALGFSPTLSGGVGRCHLAEPRPPTHFGPLNKLSFRLGAVGNPVPKQESANRPPTDMAAFRQLVDGHAGKITFDKIRSIRWLPSVPSGFHVYDLQTVEGYYTALTSAVKVIGGMIVHNCRCQAIEIFEERDEVPAPEGPVEIDGEQVMPGPDEGFAFNPGKLMQAALELAYNPDQPRDERGQWSAMGAAILGGLPAEHVGGFKVVVRETGRGTIKIGKEIRVPPETFRRGQETVKHDVTHEVGHVMAQKLTDESREKAVEYSSDIDTPVTREYERYVETEALSGEFSSSLDRKLDDERVSEMFRENLMEGKHKSFVKKLKFDVPRAIVSGGDFKVGEAAFIDTLGKIGGTITAIKGDRALFTGGKSYPLKWLNRLK